MAWPRPLVPLPFQVVCQSAIVRLGVPAAPCTTVHSILVPVTLSCLYPWHRKCVCLVNFSSSSWCETAGPRRRYNPISCWQHLAWLVAWCCGAVKTLNLKEPPPPPTHTHSHTYTAMQRRHSPVRCHPSELYGGAPTAHHHGSSRSHSPNNVHGGNDWCVLVLTQLKLKLGLVR